MRAANCAVRGPRARGQARRGIGAVRLRLTAPYGAGFHVQQSDCGESGFVPAFRSTANGIDGLQPHEIPLVIRHDDTVVSAGDGRDDHVQCTTWTTGCLAVGHQPCPDQRGFVVERKNPACEECLKAFWSGEPGIKRVTLLAPWLFPFRATAAQEGKSDGQPCASFNPTGMVPTRLIGRRKREPWRSLVARPAFLSRGP